MNRTLVFLVTVTAVGGAAATPAAAKPNDQVTLRLAPSVTLGLENSSPSAAVGLSFRPDLRMEDDIYQGFRFDLQGLIGDESRSSRDTTRRAASETFGARLRLQFERSQLARELATRPRGFIGGQLTLSGQWTAQKFRFTPVDEDTRNEWRHNYAFSFLGLLAIQGTATSSTTSVVEAPNKLKIKVTNYQTSFWAPQLKLTYGREYEEGERVAILPADPDDRTAELGVADAPSARLRGELMAGVMWQPVLAPDLPDLTFATAFRLRTNTEASKTDPFSDEIRLRQELWAFWFYDIAKGTSARFGAAVFTEQRLQGDPSRSEAFVAGVNIQLSATQNALLIDP